MRTGLDRTIGAGVGLMLVSLAPLAWTLTTGRQLSADWWLSAAWVGMAGVAVLGVAALVAVGQVLAEQAGSCRRRSER